MTTTDMKSVSFNPQKDIPSLEGKVVLVTGGNNGLGKQAILELARHQPKLIWLAARDVAKAEAAIRSTRDQVPGANMKPLKLDLASFESVKQASKIVVSESDRLDLLMLNAGIMASAAAVTKDGYELQFGTNHMGHALLTKCLLPLLTKTSQDGANDVRVVVVSSAAYKARPTHGVDFDVLKTSGESMSTIFRYGQSKLANILFARELARENPQIRVASVHPGTVKTNLTSSMTGLPFIVRGLDKLASYFYVRPEEGVKNQLWAATSTDYTSGEYIEPVGQLGKLVEEGLDDTLSRKLWDWTEKELQEHHI